MNLDESHLAAPSRADRARAELELRRRARLKAVSELAESSEDHYGEWLKKTRPAFQWDLHFQTYIRSKLPDIISGRTPRTIFNVPPQHGKSNLLTIPLPVYLLELDPKLRIGVAAYSQFLANKFSRSARRLARGRIALAGDRTAVEEWETVEGGVFRAVGRGGGISGQPFDIFIIDDLIKGRKEADSQAVAEEIKEWYAEEVYPRARIIIYVGTRWGGLADPVNYWLDEQENAEGWIKYNIPAEAEADDPLGRPVGSPLAPELGKTKEFLDKARRVLGLAYFALYQGTPVPKGGKMFRDEMFVRIPAERLPRPAEFDALVRYWDRAGSLSDDAAFTSGTLIGYCRNVYWILDNVHGKFAELERDKKIRDTAESDYKTYGGRVETWIECEPGFTGEESVKRTISRCAPYDVKYERVTGDKVERARGYAAQCQAGNFRIKAAPWTKGFVDEHILFPFWKWKDRVDSGSGAFNKVADYSEGAYL